MADWFDQNAPQTQPAPQSTAGKEDWFDQNQPQQTQQTQQQTEGYWSHVAKNILPSLQHFIQNTAPGPTGGELPNANPNGRFSQAHPQVAERFPMIASAADSLEELGHRLMNPSEFFEEDPVNALQTYGTLGRGGVEALRAIPGGAAAMETAATATKAIPRAVAAGVKAAAPGVGTGAAIMAGTGAASEMLPSWGRAIVGLPGLYAGGSFIRGGLKAGFEAARDAYLDTKVANVVENNAAMRRLQEAYNPETAPKTTYNPFDTSPEYKRLQEAYNPETAPRTNYQLASPVNPAPAPVQPFEPMGRPMPEPGPEASEMSLPTPRSRPAKAPSAQPELPASSGISGTTPDNALVTDKLYNAMTRLQSAPGNNVTFLQLLKAPELADIPREELGQAAEQLQKEGRVLLNEHGYVGSTPAKELGATTVPGTGKHYVSMYQRDMPVADVTANQTHYTESDAFQMAKWLQRGGATAEDANAFSAGHWNTLAREAGLDPPDLRSQGRVAFYMHHLPGEAAATQETGVSPQMVQRLQQTGAMPAAQQLRQMMGQ